MNSNITPVELATDDIDFSTEGAKLEIPNFTPKEITLGWSKADYFAILGADTTITKLADSHIAPLIAAARGSASVTSKNLATVAESVGAGSNPKTGRGSMLTKATVDGEALVMPWYSLTDIRTAAATGTVLVPTTFQARPQIAPAPVKGKKGPKYRMPQGEGTVVGAHPATPMEWITEAATYMVVEGQLKAEAALTAQLRSVATYEELTNACHGSVASARAALAEIMGRVPAAERVLIVEVPACWTWREKGDWDALAGKGKRAIIGLDGDLADKIQVWKAAKALHGHLSNKGARSVGTLRLPVTDTSNGVDDFLKEGGTWEEVLDLVGELPPCPEIRGWTQGFAMAKVDSENGITYMVEHAPTEDGSKGEPQKKAIAELAVQITEASTVRSPYPNEPLSNLISGVSSWVQRDEFGTQVGVGEAKFTDLRLAMFDGGPGKFSDIITNLTNGEGLGAYFPRAKAQDVMDAWRTTASYSRRTERLLTTGLWLHKGEMHWVGANGAITASGLTDELKAVVPDQPAVTVHYLDPITEAKEITDAFEAFERMRTMYSKPMRAVYVAKLGTTLALAVGVHPKGGLMTVAEPGSGKTLEQYCFGGMYGNAWTKNPGVKMEGTPAALREKFFAGNNMLLSVDDVREANEDNRAHNRTMRVVSSEVIRVSYEPSSEYAKKVMDDGGRWTLRASREDSMRVGSMSGESIEELDLTRSTVTRLMTFTVDVNAGETFLAGRGRIAPMLEELQKTDAGAKLLGAFIVHTMRQTQGAEKPAEAIGERVRELAAKQDQWLAGTEGAPAERSREYLAPVLGAMESVQEMIAEAYRRQGLESKAAEVEVQIFQDRQDLLESWQRHRALYGAAAEVAAESSVMQSLQNALSANRACLDTPPDDNPRAMPVGRLIDSETVFLVPGLVTAALREFGDRNLDQKRVAKALKLFSIDGLQIAQRVNGKPVRGYKVSKARWDESMGFTSQEIEAMDAGEKSNIIPLPVIRNVAGQELAAASGEW